MNLRPLAALLLVAACSTPPPPSAPERTPPADAATATPPAPPRELPFDPSPDDKASLGATGFVGVVAVPPETGFVKGPKLAGVKPGGGLEAAGLKEGDVLVKFAGVSFAATDDDAIGSLRKRMSELPFDSDVQITYWREKEGVREVTVRLGRQPPPFANLDTPAKWLAPVKHDEAVAKLLADAVALDHGEARYADVLARNRKHLSKTDSFRLQETTQAHLDLAANEPMARELTDRCMVAEFKLRPDVTIDLAASYPPMPPFLKWNTSLEPGSAREMLDRRADVLVQMIQHLDGVVRTATASWTLEERTFVKSAFPRLSERLNEGEYLYDDPDVARERDNRRLIRLFAKADRTQLAIAARFWRWTMQEFVLRELRAAVAAVDEDGLLVARDTPAGRVEIWGGGNTRHTTRCAFCFDLGGNDDWLDCAGRADLDQPISVSIDWDGDDTYGGTSTFNEGAALGGIGVLWDHAGDDQYLARTWSQGCGVAGFGLLRDDGGRDAYHGQDECQGVGFAGAGVLDDRCDEDPGTQFAAPPSDLYTGVRFCQGVGMPGGVGALVEHGGDDRYVCTSRYDSEYGEPGLFSGWGQGVGFGFRNVASGGIGVLYDLAGDDVYEAGNFSQGGGYFYAWGILRDDAGNDRYIGSRYAQGFAAHQAVGTFLEGGGNDLYQSHSSVADGLSWDETSVVFHDLWGDDVYEQGGFSLASAAHNAMALFLDDAGNDVYAAAPAHAASNEYHGGHSFALFADRGGRDTYGGAKDGDLDDRVLWRDEGAYFLDLPPDPKPLTEYVRK